MEIVVNATEFPNHCVLDGVEAPPIGGLSWEDVFGPLPSRNLYSDRFALMDTVLLRLMALSRRHHPAVPRIKIGFDTAARPSPRSP